MWLPSPLALKKADCYSPDQLSASHFPVGEAFHCIVTVPSLGDVDVVVTIKDGGHWSWVVWIPGGATLSGTAPADRDRRVAGDLSPPSVTFS